jgi:uncharacterized membrane protein (DUF4010 family)
VSAPAVEGLSRLAVALLIGLLIGLDRERAEMRKSHAEFAGVRTFPLVALTGAIPMLFTWPWAPLFAAGAFLAVAAIAVVSYQRTSAAGDVGATTEIAAITTFLLGALAGAGQLVVAAAAGVAVAVLLVAKPRLEAFSRALTAEEISAVLELAVISVIVLPLLPDRGFGPWEVFNPRSLWLVVVLVAGLSFLGFVAVRVVGERRGLAITGAVGGLVSSTAVTVAMADRARGDGEAVAQPAAAATVLASTVMAGRIGVLAGVINAGILSRILPVVGAMIATGLVAAWLIVRRRGSEGEGEVAGGSRIRNPFSLKAAFTWAVVYAVILLVARAATEYLGQGGIFAVAAVSAVADVDAVTIAFTQLGAQDGAWRLPAAAVALAAVTNTVVKLGIAWWRGAGSFRGRPRGWSSICVDSLASWAAHGDPTGATAVPRAMELALNRRHPADGSCAAPCVGAIRV